MTDQQLSNMFQTILNLIQSLYKSNPEGSRFDIYEAFAHAYKKNQLKGKIVKAVSTLTVKDIFGILTHGVSLIIPKPSSKT